MRFILLSFVALIVCVPLSGCKAELSDHDKNYVWNFLITVSVDTPSGIKHGSVIRELKVKKKAIGWSEINKAPQYSVKKSIEGEAVYVDLEEIGNLFMIMEESHSKILKAFGFETYDELNTLSLGSKATLDPTQYSRIVTFKNISDPLSVELLHYNKFQNSDSSEEKYSIEDNFNKIFGNDVRLNNISVELTSEPATFKISEVLPWLEKVKDKKLDGTKFQSLSAPNRLANSLAYGNFTTKR